MQNSLLNLLLHLPRIIQYYQKLIEDPFKRIKVAINADFNIKLSIIFFYNV